MTISSSRAKTEVSRLQAQNTRLQAHIEALSEQLRQLQGHLDEAKAKMDALCAPANHSVVITDVQCNGSRRVEVCRQGAAARDWVNVEPDIPAEKLKVGAAGLLAEKGNCLLEVIDRIPMWKEVGGFDRYDGHGRMVVNQDGRTIAIRAADQLHDVELKKGDEVGFDELAGLAYVRLESPTPDDLFTEDFTQDRFDRLGGLDRQIAQIKELIDRGISHRGIADNYNGLLDGKAGVLLYGPPGNGKTALARCTASYLKELMPDKRCRFMNVTGSEDYSMWLGKAEERLRQRFAAAEQAAKEGTVLMFIDEFDAIAYRRGADYGSRAPDRILNTLLGLLDGVIQSSPSVLIMAATNRADNLDRAVLRPGRFDEKIEIPPPRRAAAAAILRSYLAGAPLHRSHQGTLDELVAPLLSQIYSPRGAYAGLVKVKLADGRVLDVPPQQLVSGATLEKVVRNAAREAFNREVRGGEGGVSAEDLAVGLSQEMHATAGLLTWENVKSYVTSIPNEARPVDVLVDRGHTGAYTRR